MFVFLVIVFIWLRPLAGSCEHGNEHSGSIKPGEFLDWLSILLTSQEGLRFTYRPTN
jgi:hypothetical protein